MGNAHPRRNIMGGRISWKRIFIIRDTCGNLYEISARKSYRDEQRLKAEGYPSDASHLGGSPQPLTAM
jgi:hypothetical protein